MKRVIMNMLTHTISPLRMRTLPGVFSLRLKTRALQLEKPRTESHL